MANTFTITFRGGPKDGMGLRLGKDYYFIPVSGDCKMLYEGNIYTVENLTKGSCEFVFEVTEEKEVEC